MDLETTKRKPSWAKIVWFVVTVGLAVLAHFADLGTFLQSDWSADYSASISRVLPSYVAACVVVAILAVIVGLRRFPKHIAVITAGATALVLTGGFLQLKIIREADVDHARVEEADMLADDILSLRGVPDDRLEDEARSRLRKIVVSMYGEAFVGDMFLKPKPTGAIPSEKEANR